MHLFAADFFNLKLQQAVIQEDSVAITHILRECIVRGWDNTILAQHIGRGNHHSFTTGQGHDIAAHHTGTNFWSLQVTENGNSALAIPRDLPDQSHRFG